MVGGAGGGWCWWWVVLVVGGGVRWCLVTQGDGDVAEVLVDVERGPGQGRQARQHSLVHLINTQLTHLKLD